MTAEAYLALPADGHRYELVDGVICMSPSPSFQHQRILAEIAKQIGNCIESGGGAVAIEVDVRLSAELVYRPDVIYLCDEKARQCTNRVNVVPDVVVEVVSPESGQYDRQTKRDDYERFGVAEYWIIDPLQKEIEFYRLSNGAFEPVEANGGTFESIAIPGMRLQLDPIRTLFA